MAGMSCGTGNGTLVLSQKTENKDKVGGEFFSFFFWPNSSAMRVRNPESPKPPENPKLLRGCVCYIASDRRNKKKYVNLPLCCGAGHNKWQRWRGGHGRGVNIMGIMVYNGCRGRRMGRQYNTEPDDTPHLLHSLPISWRLSQSFPLAWTSAPFSHIYFVCSRSLLFIGNYFIWCSLWFLSCSNREYIQYINESLDKRKHIIWLIS